MNTLNSLLTRFKNLTAIGKVKKINYQKAQVQLRKNELKELERIQPYGFSSIPDLGSDAFVVFSGGERLNGKVLAIQNKNYSINLKATEVAIYSQNNNSIIFKNDGTIVFDGLPIFKEKAKFEKGIEVVGNGEFSSNVKAENIVASTEATVNNIKFTTHAHSNGNNGSPTGPPQ